MSFAVGMWESRSARSNQSIMSWWKKSFKQPSNKFHLTYYNRFTYCISGIGESDSYQQYFDLLKMFSKRNKYSQENKFIYVQYIIIYIYLYCINVKSKFTQQMTLSGQYTATFWGEVMWHRNKWTRLYVHHPMAEVKQIKTLIKFKLNICVGAPSYFWLQEVYLLMATLMSPAKS